MAANLKEIQKAENAKINQLKVLLAQAITLRESACNQRAKVVAMADFQERRADQYQKILKKVMERREKGCNKVRVNVEFSDRSWKAYDIWVNPDDTVGIVKAIVEHISEVPVRLQRLFYLGKEFDDDEALKEFFQGGELHSTFKQNSQ